MRRATLVSLGLLALAACAGQAQYRNVHAYMGKDVKEYVRTEEENERPAAVVQLPDGSKAFTWEHRWTWEKRTVTLIANREGIVEAYRLTGWGDFDKSEGDPAKLKAFDDAAAEAALAPQGQSTEQ